MKLCEDKFLEIQDHNFNFISCGGYYFLNSSNLRFTSFWSFRSLKSEDFGKASYFNVSISKGFELKENGKT